MKNASRQNHDAGTVDSDTIAGGASSNLVVCLLEEEQQ